MPACRASEETHTQRFEPNPGVKSRNYMMPMLLSRVLILQRKTRRRRSLKFGCAHVLPRLPHVILHELAFPHDVLTSFHGDASGLCEFFR